MLEFIENLADQNEWFFDYGRADFLNLTDKEHDDKVLLLLDPLQHSPVFTEHGNTIRR
ncbi:hypothetical protein SAMN05192545_0013 [Maribacter dokdonensis]|uniref:Uncharacterized protein n=1 Tax=Maribacter dokdonensis TaxID=320912 RepID=A0ABY0TXW5_9FLAO|nr:hypothetical protein [Maribacter dokdonensis]SDR74374.1 hypothetical protein SAMN05192545_0013 [Maribacter dokdonensis]